MFYLRTLREIRDTQKLIVDVLQLLPEVLLTIQRNQRLIMATQAEVAAELKGIKDAINGFIPTVVTLVTAAQNEQNASADLKQAADDCQTAVANLGTALTPPPPVSPPPTPPPESSARPGRGPDGRFRSGPRRYDSRTARLGPKPLRPRHVPITFVPHST